MNLKPDNLLSSLLLSDILNIQSWPNQLNDLSVFSSLTTIQGRSLYKYVCRVGRVPAGVPSHANLPVCALSRRFSLMVMRIPTLTSLGLRSLREISDGSVYISQNAKLCYHHTVNWTQLFRGGRARVNSLSGNRPLTDCGALE